ncbi:uncharacterized protein LOC106050771 [Biomphalaria glabrata]|uniref:Uncharacterized protein LOC106050771 n=1 Tax=Biomphalaria glabrata TaxID=6526 RepID=A0A9W3BMA0_BIOGL|nr:uncharacterized protein LOC106050771 [Biomphalaria glabrata]
MESAADSCVASLDSPKESSEGATEALNDDLSNRDSSVALLLKTANQDQRETQIFHIDDVLSGIKLGQFHWRMLALVGGGYFAVCSEMMLFIFLTTAVKKEWQLGDMDFPWLPFCTGLTGIIGGYIAGVISDAHGRRLPFLFGIIFIALFGVVSAFAPSFLLFIASRCMVAIGTGAFESVGFVLLLECLPKHRRGAILVIVTLCGALGAVTASGLNWLIQPRFGWRWFVCACAAPAILLLMFQPFAFFESPRFLLAVGKRREAEKVLLAIARINKCFLPDLDKIISPPSVKPRFVLFHLFTEKLRRHTLAFSLIWFLQAAGYWGVTVYLPEYMDKLGVDPYLNMFSVFIGEIPGLFLAMILIESHMLGRIRTLRFFSSLTAGSLLVFSIIPHHAFKAVLIIACYFSMVPIYSILNAFTPELYPTDIRSTAMAWMNVLIEIPGLITPFASASLVSSDLPWLYPVTWGSVFLIQCLLTLAIKTETAGKELRDCVSEDQS